MQALIGEYRKGWIRLKIHEKECEDISTIDTIHFCMPCKNTLRGYRAPPMSTRPRTEPQA